MNDVDIQTYKENLIRLEQNIEFLNDKPEENAETSLKAIWMVAAGLPMSVQKASSEEMPSLGDKQKKILTELIAKRISGVPLAHITGLQEFMGIDFRVNDQALVPRQETEILGYMALDKVNNVVKHQGHALILDVCTGCGNLALSIIHHQPNVKIYAMDLSKNAIELARKNQQFMNVDNSVEFLCGDLLEPVKNKQIESSADVIICNPPYITTNKLLNLPGEIIKYEPDLAFNGGALGINIINRLCKEALYYLKPGGWLVFELGLGQGDAVLKRLRKKGLYSYTDVSRDEEGNIRVIILQR